MKKSTLFTIIILIIFSFSTKLSSQNYWKLGDTLARNIISVDDLRYDVSFLSDSLCDGRATGTKGSTVTKFWLCGQFKQANLLPINGSYSTTFDIKGSSLIGRNIIGLLPGEGKTDINSYIIIGAHFDHIGNLDGKLYPGADANASGVVAVTSLAKIFASMKEIGRKYNSNIIFVGFDAHLHSLAGSKELWRMIKDKELIDPITGSAITRNEIKYMINIDQIGSSLAPIIPNRKNYLIMLGNNRLDYAHSYKIGKCNSFYYLNLDIGHSYYGSEHFTNLFYTLSDQKIFIENGIKSFLFTSGITMNTNKTWDRADSLDYEVYRKRIMLIFHWLEKML